MDTFHALRDSRPDMGHLILSVRISIIIPAFNEQRLLGSSLEEVKASCVAFHQRGWETEIVVCDNNSTDRTAVIAKSAGALVVQEPFNQIARARNRGAAAASGDWLIFVDADSHPSPELFDDVAREIAGGRCLAGGCVIRMKTRRPVARFFSGLWNCISRWGTLMAGSFIFVEAVAFRAVGGFNEQYFAGEELDLSERLKKMAAKTEKKVVILSRHPLVTSGRKMELYSSWEMLLFFLRATFRWDRVLSSREACHPWYDGRR